MTELVTHTTPEPRAQRMLRGLQPGLHEAAVVLGLFAVLGVVGGVVWELVAPLAEYTRVAENGTMGEEELARQFDATGWFVAIAAVGGLVTGFVLLLLRRRTPILTVVLVAVGGGVASLVMALVGFALGPADPNDVLQAAALGDKVPLQLQVEGAGAYLVWSISAMAGALAALLFYESPAEQAAREERILLSFPPNG